MIQSKPKTSTLTSLILFALALLFAFVYVFNLYWFQGQRGAWVMISLGFLTPTTMLIIGRIVLGYKTLRIHKDQFWLTYPFRFSTIKYPLKQLNSWEIIQVKTANGLYEELELRFENRRGKLSFSKQEHSGYDKIKGYLQRKAGSLEVKSGK